MRGRAAEMDKLLSIIAGIAVFPAYMIVTFILGFVCSPQPRKFEENSTNAYIISCIIGAGLIVALMVEKGVLPW